jgi:hypothetical protein
MTTQCTNTNLNELVDWINAYGAAHNRADSVPLVRRQRWRLSTSQFRRTLAWFIARQSGGTIAGTIQYRHHSIEMFEGYAGTSDSGFRGEVEAEQALERGERLLAIIDNHEHMTYAAQLPAKPKHGSITCSAAASTPAAWSTTGDDC